MLTVKQREQLEYLYRVIDKDWALSITHSLLGPGEFHDLLNRFSMRYETQFESYQPGLEIKRFRFKNTKGYMPEGSLEKLRLLIIPYPELAYALLSDAGDELGVTVNYGIMDDIVELGPTNDYLRQELEIVMQNVISGEEYQFIVEVE